MRAYLKCVNRHGAVVFGAILFIALCGAAHFLAIERMGIAGRQFPVMSTRTMHTMALIDFLNSHGWFAAVFVFVFICSLLCLELHNAPRWSVWLTFLSFAAPCVFYLMICAQISNKIVFLMGF